MEEAVEDTQEEGNLEAEAPNSVSSDDLNMANELDPGTANTQNPGSSLLSNPAANNPAGSAESASSNIALPLEAGAGGPTLGLETQSGDTTQRQVRFVKTNGTTVYSRADTSASSVATLFQGDPLVVKLLGDWAEISSDRFVKNSELSEKVIPRQKLPNPWKAPAAP